MLEQVCETGATGLFPRRSYVVKKGNRNDRVRIVLVKHDIEPIVEFVFLEVDPEARASGRLRAPGAGRQGHER